MTYSVAFDLEQAGYDWTGAASGAVFVSVCVAMLVFRGQVVQFIALRWIRRHAVLLIAGLTTLAVVLTANVFVRTYLPYRHGLAALRHGDCGVVEGVVSAFHAERVLNHTEESFVVQGVEFSYADSIEKRVGFQRTSLRGGPIRAGLPVRIHYATVNGRREILRLEVGVQGK